MSIDNNLERELDYLKSVKVDYIDRGELLRFIQLFEAQMAQYAAIGDLPPDRKPVIPDPERFESGNPLLDHSKLFIDTKWAGNALVSTGAVLFQPDNPDSIISELEMLWSSDDLNPSVFLRWAAGNTGVDLPELSEITSLDEEQLRLWSREAGRPWYWRLSEGVPRPEPSQWQFGFCPLCGSKPELGLIAGEEGRRYLVCGLCNMQWEFRRVKCPYCDEERAEKLRYFVVDTTDYLRVDVCDTCHGYVKTVDARKWAFTAKIYPRIQMVLTLHLDALADKEGFTRNPKPF